MERKSCFKEFIQYAALNVLGMLGLSCYILADTFFVSKALGAQGLASLNLALPVYSLLHGCGLMFGVGGATKYSIFKGQGAVRSCNRIFTNTLYMAIVFAALFVLSGIFLPEKITALLGADREIFHMTKTYLKVILLFSPAFMLNDVFLCFVRNDGSPSLSMLAMLFGSLSNVALDYIFLFPLQMGIFGAVLATGFAPIISMIILSAHLKRKERFRLERTMFWGHFITWILSQKKNSLDILSLGTPSLIGEVASGVVMLVFNMIILQLCGNVGVAAYGVIANLSLVVLSIYTGIAQGMQPLISTAYGHSDKKSILQLLQYALITMMTFSFIIYLCIILFADFITGVFNNGNDMQLQALAVHGLKIYFLAIPFAGFNVVLSMFFTATKKALPAQLLSLLRGIVLIVPAAYLLSFAAGLTGVWMAFPVTEGIVACMGGLIFLFPNKRNTKSSPSPVCPSVSQALPDNNQAAPHNDSTNQP